jgi:cyclohexyl-isocyanide hydratase
MRITIPIYATVDMIDVAAPVDVFSRIQSFWPGHTVDIQLAAETRDPVMTGQSVALVPTATFDDLDPGDTNLLLVPGSYDVSGARSSSSFMDFLREHAADADYVTSVCTGALLLGYAGLLDGYRATTHWAAIAELQKIGGIEVVNGYPRYVHDRNRFTTGGVSSSLDGALKLTSIFTGSDDIARAAQLLIQYHPQPPFDAGDPAVADYDTYKTVTLG